MYGALVGKLNLGGIFVANDVLPERVRLQLSEVRVTDAWKGAIDGVIRHALV